ncbi:hypothetical protein A4H02_03990 [Fervidobacterium thailandense]|uniref:PNPLA domain-containing protein n=1 Tax=Fervidobacterium thailandense TaxID=1008305 RepID=A0A1E3G4E0_9BACT|nr:hypothetical protein A4H02_03990 [Fervidobacterium thailandense]
MALQAGGVRGFSHIAVLEFLEHYGIAPEILAGSSIGAVVGALYCIYEDAKTVYQVLSENIRLALNSGGRKGGRVYPGPFTEVRMLFSENLFSLDDYYVFFRRMFGRRRFSELKRKLLVVSFDLAARESLVIDEGFLVDAVLASCTVPGFFEPPFLGGSKQLDGGVLSPLPVTELKRFGVEIVVASAFEVERTSPKTFEDLLELLDALREKEILENEIRQSDYAFVFPLRVEWMEFDKYRVVYENAKNYLAGRKHEFEDFLRRRLDSLFV